MRKFLYFCAGSDSGLLGKCARWEQFRHASVGTLVLMTGCLAFISSGYALSSVFGQNHLATLLAASIWAFMIFTVDRFIVMSMSETGMRRILFLIPRLLLAIAISIVIARPLELRIFDVEIREAVDRDRAAELDAAQSQLQRLIADRRQELQGRIDNHPRKNELAAVDDEIQTLTKSMQNCKRREFDLLRSYQAELDGTGGTGLIGIGPIARAKWRSYDDVRSECKLVAEQRAEALVNQDRLRNIINDEIEVWRQATSESIDSLQEVSRARMLQIQEYGLSLLSRHRALSKLQRDDKGVQQMVWMVTILFILVECAPILAKFFVSTGLYEKLQAKTREEEDLELYRAMLLRETERRKIDSSSDAERTLADEAGAAVLARGREALSAWKGEFVDREPALQELGSHASSLAANAFRKSNPHLEFTPPTRALAHGFGAGRLRRVLKGQWARIVGRRRRQVVFVVVFTFLICYCVYYWFRDLSLALGVGGLLGSLLSWAINHTGVILGGVQYEEA